MPNLPKISLNNTLCMVVDFQERLSPSINNIQTVIKNSQILLECLNVLGVPIIVTRQYPKGLGDTLDEIKQLTTDCKVFDKITFSCFADKKIEKHILSMQNKNIILIGIESHICVLQTLVDLQRFGFQTILVEDCIGSRKESDKRIALKRAIFEGSIISSYESILFELLEEAGTETFKKISKLIK